MQRTTTIALATVTVLVAAGAALAGGERCRKAAETDTAAASIECDRSAEACLRKMAAKIRAKGWLGIETQKNADGRYEVVAVEPRSPAAAAGFELGDVLLALDRLDLYAADRERLEALERDLTVGSEIRYTVATSGQKREIDVTLAEVPARIMAQWIGRHMLDHHAQLDVGGP